MASTYFHNHGNIEMQGNGDALQTLILMNPAYVGYSDNQHHLPPPPPPPPTNFIFLNNSSSSAAATPIHHFSGIPLQDSPQHQDVSDLHGGSSPRFHYNLYNPQINGGAAREFTRAKQGLSLSLSSQQPARPAPETAAAQPGAAEVRVLGGVPDNVVLSCKYLKVAQQLLDEVVNIGKEAKNGRELSKEDDGNPKNNAEAAAAAAGDGGAKGGAELTTAEKQEIQMKKAKLVDILDEVEQRYKQYEQQMQMVISWFEEAGGVGSAKTYTALALQTISKQFRCLKDAIMAQIGAATRNLGEEENFGRKSMEGSRLKYIDNQIRQQQQQFGMIQNSAWRPQRGLPEQSVSVLRAWLFQHFLHPYPKDTDKIMLAKQAGLTRSQVSNWFINARVRLWKPMVEEMYAEEIKGQQKSGSSTEKSSDEVKEANTKSQEINNVGLFNLIGSSEMETQQARRSPKKPRNTTMTPDVSMRFGYDDERLLLQSREGFTISGAPPQPAANFFGTYPLVMGSVEQFQPPYSSNGVSLTLGLQNSNQNRSSSAENDFGSLNVHDTTSSAAYDNIDVHNSKRFADFVT